MTNRLTRRTTFVLLAAVLSSIAPLAAGRTGEGKRERTEDRSVSRGFLKRVAVRPSEAIPTLAPGVDEMVIHALVESGRVSVLET